MAQHHENGVILRSGLKLSALQWYLFFFLHAVSPLCRWPKRLEGNPFALWSVFIFPGTPLEKKGSVACLADKPNRAPDRKLQWEEVRSFGVSYFF